MLYSFFKALSYPFMLKAVIVGLLISIVASILGVILVLKKYSMIGDGLSHVGFGAIAVAVALNKAPLIFAIPIVIIVSIFLLKINENNKIKGDSAIALISTSSLAIGIMVLSIIEGVNTNISNYLFGSILGISNEEVFLSIILFFIVIIIFIIFYHKIFAVVFDENFAKATGIKVEIYKTIISVLTSLIIVLGMKTMGALLISSLMIFPALTSIKLIKSYKYVLINSIFISIICFLIGIIFSYTYNLPTGATISIVNLSMFLIYSLLSIIFKIGK